jgi:hypothetical protein
LDPAAFVKKYAILGLYHFTSAQNVAGIQAHGILSRRVQTERGIVCAEPGGDELSLQLDEEKGLDRYIHLCLRSSHPMVYAQQIKGRLQEVRWFRVHPDILSTEGILYYPDNSMKGGVEPVTLTELCEMADFELLTKWADLEILVPDQIPTSALTGVFAG